MATCVAGGAAVSATKGNTTTTTYDSKDRVTKKVFANKGSLWYTYSGGILSGVTRNNAAGTTQEYLFIPMAAFFTTVIPEMGSFILSRTTTGRRILPMILPTCMEEGYTLHEWDK